MNNTVVSVNYNITAVAPPSVTAEELLNYIHEKIINISSINNNDNMYNTDISITRL